MSAALQYAIFSLLLFHQGSALNLEQTCGKCSVFTPTPWLVKIRTDLSSNITCAGTLINERFVLTAASCIDGASEIIVRLGEIDGTPNKSSKFHYEEIGVRAAIIHRLYSSKSYQHNIALLRLKTSVVYKMNIQPICIDVNAEKVPRAPTFLIEIKKPVVPKKPEEGWFKKSTKWFVSLFKGKDPDTEREVSLEPEASAIGWPLNKQIDNSAIYYQSGILSHHNLGSKTDVYTDVMAYADWIVPIALDVNIIMAPNTDFDN